MRDRLFDVTDPQKFTFDFNPPLGYEQFSMWVGFASEHIHINMDVNYSDDSEAFYDAMNDGRPTDAACVVADVAATIIHELLHGCLSVFRDNWDSCGECDHTYMLGASWKWAIAQRFPCIASGSCYEFSSDSMWMNDTGFEGTPADCG